MMKKESAIDAMLWGSRGNYDNVGESDLYWQLLKKASELQEKFDEMLAGHSELSEFYKQLENAMDEMHSEEAHMFYKEGFRFGVLMGMDILNDGRE